MSTPMPTDPIGRGFVVVAITEAFTWAGLLIGMLFKHVLEITDLGVAIFGAMHGGAFMLYAVMAVIAATRFRWGLGVFVLAMIAAVPPFTTIPLERWMRRTGRLVLPQDR